jgi:acyl-coenzyme A synthetase/AMP-(fatty) acid ligase
LDTGLRLLFVAADNVRKLRAPSLDEILAEDLVPHYAYERNFEEVADETIINIHTSGSSGNPKPIFWTHRFISSMHSGNFLRTKGNS